MFYHLLFPLREYVSGFNVFKYITFRAGGAAVTALLICFIIGPMIIRKLQRSGVVDEIREDGPPTHKAKAGTVSMGGAIILPAILIGTLLFARLDHPHVWLVIIATTWMAIVGFIDDYLKFKGAKKGLIPRYKLIGQISLGLFIGCVLYFFPEIFSQQFAEYKTLSTLPFFKYKFINFALFGLGFLFIVMVVIVETDTSNAINLLDGLDGLAIGIVGIMAVGLGILSYMSGNMVFSEYLNITYLPGSGELTVYCAAMIGASLGFLFFNAPPATVFMGDFGALSLGAGLATVAIIIKKELFLFILGGIPVLESLSVIAQRGYFKYTKRRYGKGIRLLRMSPIHHHFELLGWAESKIVIRARIISILLLFLTMTSFKVR